MRLTCDFDESQRQAMVSSVHSTIFWDFMLILDDCVSTFKVFEHKKSDMRLEIGFYLNLQSYKKLHRFEVQLPTSQIEACLL